MNRSDILIDDPTFAKFRHKCGTNIWWETFKSFKKLNLMYIYLRHPQSIITFDWYTLDWRLNHYQYLTDIPIDTRPTLDPHLINRLLIVGCVNELICIDQILVDSLLTVNQDVNWLITKVSMECQLSINQVSMDSPLNHMIQPHLTKILLIIYLWQVSMEA